MSFKVFIFITVFGALNSFKVKAQEWKNYIQKADSFNQKQFIDSAVIYYLKAKNEISKDSFYTSTFLKLNQDIAKGFTSQKKHYEATPHIAEVQKIIKKKFGLQSAEYANWLDELGIIFFSNDDYTAAKNYFLPSKNIRQQLKNKKDYTKSCNLLGIVYSNLGEYSKAEQILLEAKPLREEIYSRESNEYAQIINNLADVYWRIGDLEHAEEFALEAKETRGRVLGKKAPAYAISCTNLANIYRDLGEYEQAEALYKEAKNIREETLGKNHALYAATCNILADLYYFMKKNSQAEALYQEAMAIREKLFTKNSYSYAQTCNNLSAFYRDIGEFKKAKALAIEANEIYATVLPSGHPTFPINQNNLGDLYFALGDYEKAENYYLRSRYLWEASVGQEHPYFTLTSMNLAKVYWNTNKIVSAHEHYTSASRAKFKEIDKIFSFTSEQQKQGYIKNISGSADEIFSFALKNKNVINRSDVYEISLASRHLILSSGRELKATISQSDTVTKKIYGQWRAARERLAFVSTQSITNEKEKKILEVEAGKLEKQLARRSTAFKKNLEKEKIDWKEIQTKLLPGEAAIEFAEFNFYDGRRWTDSIFYIAFLLRSEQESPEMIELFEKKKLDSLLLTTRNNGSYSLYNLPTVISNNVSAQRLYELLWKPLEAHLEGIKKIFFAPAGLLHRISFAALPINTKEVLSDKYILQHLATTHTVTKDKAEYLPAAGTIQVYGGVFYDADTTELKKESLASRGSSRSISAGSDKGNTWEYLEGSEKEISMLEKLGEEKKYHVVAKKGIVANEESMKALNYNSSPSILHIATHGFFFSDPTKEKKELLQKTLANGRAFRISENPLFRSGLLFAGANLAWTGKQVSEIDDGILTAFEVSNLYLPNTKLVVLSACETALGDIQGSEGVYGLQRAFKMAGVQNLIMSLWKVPDAEAAEFMEIFYSNLFNGRSIYDSFRTAQTEMKNKYRREPYKWAAWILMR